MPELRKDIVNGRWVIIATDRARRPNEFPSLPDKPSEGKFCPFCEGKETKTPPEVLARRRNGTGPDTPGWSVRVVPNKFPALRRHGELGSCDAGIFECMSGIGAHEVIIESPNHTLSLAELSEDDIQDVLWAFRERIVELKKDPKIRYVLIFKNHGLRAGATLEHTHSQLIALPIVPIRVHQEMLRSREYYEQNNRCVFCNIIEEELKSQERVIFENRHFFVLSPYAARFPFECWILPKNHEAAFELSPEEWKPDLARTLKQLLQAFHRVLGHKDYNFLLHTAPVIGDYQSSYHWHFEVMPRLTHVAGFEWGSGFYINPTTPELAAESLREGLEHAP